MHHNRPCSMFFTGSHTEVGKTYCAAAALATLAKAGHGLIPYKAVASGCREQPDGTRISEDAEQLWKACNGCVPLDLICPQRFLAPLAPPEAAAREGKSVDQDRLLAGFEACAAHGLPVLVEGAGGLLSPISDDWTNADLAKRLGLPLVIVVANRLGAINQALLTITAARSHGLTVLGVVLSDGKCIADESCDSNLSWLQKFAPDVPWARLRADAIELESPAHWVGFCVERGTLSSGATE